MQLPSYRWDSNSCWLDTALELIFYTTNRDFSVSFAPTFVSIPQTHCMWPLVQAMDLRNTLQHENDNTGLSNTLTMQRDGIRTHLKNERIVSKPKEFSSLFVSTSSATWYFLANSVLFRAG